MRLGPCIAKMRESFPFFQYATPRVEPPRGAGLPSSCGGMSNHTTLPVVGSSATTVPTPLDMYRRPSAMIGVFCQLPGPCASGYADLSSDGIADCRQATASRPAVSLLIWSRDEYFVAPLSPEYAGQSRSAPFCPVTVHAVPTASAITTSQQSLCFTGISLSRWDYTDWHAGIPRTKLTQRSQRSQRKQPRRKGGRARMRRTAIRWAPRSGARGDERPRNANGEAIPYSRFVAFRHR